MQSPFLQASGLLQYIGLFLSGVCHQFPDHSFFLAGVHTPLCARCTGTYLGASFGLCYAWLRGRSRASQLPPARVLAMLGAFIAFWAIDGLNSYVHFLTGNALLYTPNNLLRLTAGMLNGLSLSALIFPLFNSALWQAPAKARAVNGLGELGGMLLPIIALEVLLQANVGVLLYPLLLADVLSVLLMLTIVNSMIVMILLRWENRAEHWRQVFLPLSLGLVLSVVEVGGIALLRYMLWSKLL